MSSIGSILTAKELSQTYQPLLLCEFEFVDGSFFRASTHPLAAGYAPQPTSGSYQYSGFDWVPRVMAQDIGAMQAMSDIGVDLPPQVTIQLADADKYVYETFETPVGFKGAILKLYSVMWDAGNSLTGSFNTDIPFIKFIGVCGPASFNSRTLSVTATSLLNMTQQQVPPLRIQPLCPWSFPIDYAARLDGANNQDSPYYQCGYSPDVTASLLSVAGVGNFQTGTAAFTSCDLSKAACIDRLGDPNRPIPILQDTLGRHTGRFGGFTYIPVQNSGLQRPYTTGQWELIINATNEAKYGDYVPMCYGTTWVAPEVMGVYGDGNYTFCEMLLCFGRVQQIINTVVNGVIVPHDAGEDAAQPTNFIDSPAKTTTFSTKDNDWVTVNTGQRDGTPNPGVGWGSKGDPYGSCAAILVQTLSQLVTSSSLPQAQVLLTAGFVRVYTDPVTFSYGYSSNPAWILMDILISTNWRYADLNIQSFIDAAAVCDTQIYFNRLDGTYSNIYNESGSPEYLRYSVGFTVKQRASIGELIRGVRNAMRAMVFFNFNTGQLTVRCKQSLADQQPNPISGSNLNTPVPSVTAQGVSQNGYVAYSFDESNMLKDERSGEWSFSVYQRQNQESPNKVTNFFYDRENQYNQDISTIIDVEDVNRIGAEVTGTFNLVGPQTYDHMNRVTATWFAENYRGNPRLDYRGSFIGDTGGTLVAEFTTTIKAIHLMVGDLIFVSNQQTGIVNQLFRITRLQPSVNFETCKIVAQWHNDNWYQDTYGQGAHQPIYKNPQSGYDTNPRPWRANYESPIVGDAYYDPTDKSFGIAQMYGVAADNSPLALIQIAGELPVNAFPTVPRTPRLELIGIGDTGGGYPDGTAYFVGVSAVGQSASLSPLSNICAISLDPSQDALDFVVQSWPPDSVGYATFVGLTPNVMTLQTTASVTAALISLTNDFQYGNWGAPDEAFSYFRWRTAKELHAGVWGQEIISCTTSSLQIAVFHNYGFATNEWAGREVSVLGIQGTDLTKPTYVPIANFQVASNDADTLFLSAGDPTTCVNGGSLEEGDVVTLRILPTFGSDTNGSYFEDAKLINELNPVGVQYNIVDASNTSNIVIKLEVPEGAVGAKNTGKVAVFGFGVGWVSGDQFVADGSSIGKPILINGVTYTIASSPAPPTPTQLYVTTSIAVTSPPTYDYEFDLTALAFPFANGDHVVVQAVFGNDGANGGFTVTNVDVVNWTFELSGSTGTGAYTGGGWAALQDRGFIPGDEAGNIAFVIAGTGKGSWAKISDNTQTRCYIAGDWPVTPDETTRLVILDAVSDFDQQSQQISNSSFEPQVLYDVPVTNFGRQTIFVSVATQSQTGLLSLPVNNPFREIFLYGSQAGVSLEVPNPAPFEVVRTGYGNLTIMNLSIYGDVGVGAISRIDFLVPSIDESDLGVYGKGTLSGTASVTASFNATLLVENSRYGTAGFFGVGDYFIWDDPGNYEIDKILSVDHISGALVIQRQPPGAPPGSAYFGSPLSGHSDKAFFRLVPKLFSNAIQKNALGQSAPTTASGIPSYWEYLWAAKCPVAVLSQVIGENGNSESFTLNLAEPEIPGYRTCSGNLYVVGGGMGTDLTVGQNADFRIRVTAPDTLRVYSAHVINPPRGTDMKIRICYVTPDASAVGLLDSVTIPGDQRYSFDITSARPENQVMPYFATEWVPTDIMGDENYPPVWLPSLIANMSVTSVFDAAGHIQAGLSIDKTTPILFQQGGYIDFVIEQVGSTSAGQSLTVSVET